MQNNLSSSPSVNKLQLLFWAAIWGACLGLLFFSSYNAVNHYTASRNDVGVYVMDWEKHIPFVSWMIIPYWSIDFLYGIALFASRNKTELFRLGKRLLLAQVICISGFLLWPLHYSFVRPASSGIFNDLFVALSGFDLPYNQAPSLHICLLVILWRHYSDILSAPIFRFLSHLWFALIAVSVLTTFQHHFIDLLLGFWAGAFTLLVFPETHSPWQWRVPERGRQSLVLAAYYFAGGVLAALIGILLFPALLAWVCYWIAAALLGVCAIYLFGVPEHFGKRAGKLSWRSWMFFSPYLLGARVNSLLWTRKLPIAAKIVEGIYLGRQPNERALKVYNIEALVDLCAELPVFSKPNHYHSVPALDLLPVDSESLRKAASAIESAKSKGNVWVCCALGFSRSATAIAAWLILYQHKNCEEAIALIAAAKPQIVINSAAQKQLAVLASATSQATSKAISL